MPNTIICVPLNDGIGMSNDKYFSFVNKRMKPVEEKKIQVDDSFKGVELNLDIDFTPDADLQIILDEKVGDIIKCRGEGSLLLTYDLKGNFNMYGTYEIQTGDYLFTMRNLINKKFEIEPGSKLSWNGSMFGATSDINAIYKVKTSLFPLMALVNDTGDVKYKRRIPINCIINLKDKIMTPTINFKVDLSEADEKAKGIFNSLSQEEKDKQFISLLVLNGFMFDNNSQDQNIVYNSTEVMTNQLSNWLSKINKDVSVGVSYRPATTMSNSEVAVEMSTELLHNRVVLNVNGYTEIGNNTTAANDNGIMGDVSVEVKLNKKGTLRAKGFNRTNNDNISERKSDTQGIGIFYSQSFDKLADLLRSKKKKKKAGEKEGDGNKKNEGNVTPTTLE